MTDLPPAITCPYCGRTSYNGNDMETRFCGACQVFHNAAPDETGAQPLRLAAANQVTKFGFATLDYAHQVKFARTALLTAVQVETLCHRDGTAEAACAEIDRIAEGAKAKLRANWDRSARLYREAEAAVKEPSDG